MSEMSRGSVGVQQALNLATDPRPIPAIYEAIPTDPPPIPRVGDRSPQIPPLRGDWGSGIGDRSKSPTPAWLLRMLAAQGFITESGLGRRARLQPCPTCRQATIAGLDADVAAQEAYCDPAPLNLRGEVSALADGRRTYELWPRGANHAELDHRDKFRISGNPAGADPRRPVLTDHRCEQAVPESWRAPPDPCVLPRPVQSDEPQF